jgi:hypothetical protein
VKAIFPSTSAHYISSVKNAGAFGEILRHPRLLKGLRRAGGHIQHKTNNKEEEIEEEDRGMMEPAKFTEFNLAFATLWRRMMDLTKQELNLAKPVALPEALKIRVITKGPAFTQTVLRGLQRKMHTILRNHPAFSLIGSGAVNSKYMRDRLGILLTGTDAYLSGDYKNATNNLKSWVSETIADAICDELNIQGYEKQLFVGNLTKHWLEDEEGNVFQQQTGQLMGSVTSFPILCIANATLSCWAYEIDKMKVTTLKDWPGMINGDDIAMKCTAKGRDAWRAITQFAGLEESVGKTYFSKEFVNINSTNFNRDEVNPESFLDEDENGLIHIRTSPFVETKYVNMGLMNGLKRSGLSIGLNDQDDPSNNIGTRYRKLIRTCPSSMVEEVHKGFIDRHRDFMTKTRLPWYVPEWIGGLGLTGYKEPSTLDLRVARMILLNWKKARPISLAHGTANWKTWLVAESRAPKPYYVGRKSKGTEEYNRVVGQLCIDLLFDSDLQLDDLFQEVTSGRKVSTAIRHNARLWDPKRYQSLPAPMPNDDLTFRSEYSSYTNDERPNPHRLQSLEQLNGSNSL